ncbi:MAG: MotA/TolQ/ExbB proton channel family protein [Elusimicrobiota bacterium]|nr:MotA/TolQ/ExbB proton channel family protein [Elusimicrobiota bacterium]
MFKFVLDTLISGGPVMLPMAAVSLIAWTLIIEKYFLLLKENTNAGKFSDDIICLLRNKKKKQAQDLCLSSGKIIPSAALTILRSGSGDKQKLLNRMSQIFHERYPSLEKNLSSIAVLGQIAPLLGLLGTVGGMISVFSVIKLHGAGDPQLLAKGISEALLSTQAGLFVAIPILFFHSYLTGKTDDIMNGLEKSLMKIINFISEGKNE